MKTLIGWACVWAITFVVQAVRANEEGLKATEFRIPYEALREAAVSFLEAHCTQGELDGLRKKLNQRIAQKLQDNENLQEDAAMRAIMLDWAADNQARIRKKEPKAVVQACFYFVLFVDRKFLLPWQFREGLDEKACAEIFRYLREETQAAEKKKATPNP